jgi:hypothetical protein
MAMLAAAAGRPVADIAAAMTGVRETLDPRTGASGRCDDDYLRLVAELEQRGWLDPAVAAHARERTNR